MPKQFADIEGTSRTITLEYQPVFEMNGYGRLFMICPGYKREPHRLKEGDKLTGKYNLCKSCDNRRWREENPNYQRQWRKHNVQRIKIYNRLAYLRTQAKHYKERMRGDLYEYYRNKWEEIQDQIDILETKLKQIKSAKREIQKARRKAEHKVYKEKLLSLLYTRIGLFKEQRKAFKPGSKAYKQATKEINTLEKRIYNAKMKIGKKKRHAGYKP